MFERNIVSRYDSGKNIIYVAYREKKFAFMMSFIHETLHYLFHFVRIKSLEYFLDGLLDYVSYGWRFYKALGEKAHPLKYYLCYKLPTQK